MARALNPKCKERNYHKVACGKVSCSLRFIEERQDVVFQVYHSGRSASACSAKLELPLPRTTRFFHLVSKFFLDIILGSVTTLLWNRKETWGCFAGIRSQFIHCVYRHLTKIFANKRSNSFAGKCNVWKFTLSRSENCRSVQVAGCFFFLVVFFRFLPYQMHQLLWTVLLFAFLTA